VVHGTSDLIMSESTGRAMAEQARDGSFIPIAGAGHLSTMEQPEQVADAIGKFLITKIGATS